MTKIHEEKEKGNSPVTSYKQEVARLETELANVKTQLKRAREQGEGDR